MAVSSRTGGRFGVCLTAATRAGWGVASRVAGCVIGVRGGVYDCVTMDACACGRVGLGARSGMGRWTTCASGIGACISSADAGCATGECTLTMGTSGVEMGAGEGADDEFSADEFSPDDDDEDEALPSDAGGSGRCSRLDMLQRGHTHSRDLDISVCNESNG